MQCAHVPCSTDRDNSSFSPSQGWRRFWLSNLDIGNGGILQRPAADYEALSAEAKQRRQQLREGKE